MDIIQRLSLAKSASANKIKTFVDFFNNSDDLILLNRKDVVAIVAIQNDKDRIKKEIQELFASQEMLGPSHLRSKLEDYAKSICALKNELNKIPYSLKEIEHKLEEKSFYQNKILYQSARTYLQRCINTHAYIEAVSEVLLEKSSSTDIEDVLFDLKKKKQAKDTQKKHCAQFFKPEAREFADSDSEYEFQEKDAMSEVSSANDCQDTAPLLKKRREEKVNNINWISKAKSLLGCMRRL